MCSISVFHDLLTSRGRQHASIGIKRTASNLKKVVDDKEVLAEMRKSLRQYVFDRNNVGNLMVSNMDNVTIEELLFVGVGDSDYQQRLLTNPDTPIFPAELTGRASGQYELLRQLNDDDLSVRVYLAVVAAREAADHYHSSLGYTLSIMHGQTTVEFVHVTDEQGRSIDADTFNHHFVRGDGVLADCMLPHGEHPLATVAGPSSTRFSSEMVEPQLIEPLSSRRLLFMLEVDSRHHLLER
jgi:hypothetical protein